MAQPTSKRLLTEAAAGEHAANPATPLGAALSATILDLMSKYTSGPDLVLIGDSMTASGSGYGDYLAASTLATVYNTGVAGESSSTITARQGAIPFALTPVGGSIPASGAVDVTINSPTNSWPLIYGDGIPAGNYTGTLSGIPGTLGIIKDAGSGHQPGDRYTFTRTTPGTAVAVSAQPFIGDFAVARRNDIAIIWVGRNNIPSTAQVISDIRAMTGYLDAIEKRYLIISVCSAADETTGTSGHTAITSLNTSLATEYGQKFLDARRYMIDSALAAAGITPLNADNAAVAGDTIPAALRTDNIHFNEAGKVAVNNFIAKALNLRGWVPAYVPRAYPAAPTASTIANPSFETDTTKWGAINGAVVTRTTVEKYAGVAGGQMVHASGDSKARYPSSAPYVVVQSSKPTRVSLMVKAPVGHNIALVVQEYDAAVGFLGNVTGTAIGTGAWQAVTTFFTSRATSVNLVIELAKGAASASSTDTVYLDCLEVTQLL